MSTSKHRPPLNIATCVSSVHYVLGYFVRSSISLAARWSQSLYNKFRSNSSLKYHISYTSLKMVLNNPSYINRTKNIYHKKAYLKPHLFSSLLDKPQRAPDGIKLNTSNTLYVLVKVQITMYYHKTQFDRRTFLNLLPLVLRPNTNVGQQCYWQKYFLLVT